MDQAISMMGMPQIAKLIEFNPVSLRVCLLTHAFLGTSLNSRCKESMYAASIVNKIV